MEQQNPVHTGDRVLSAFVIIVIIAVFVAISPALFCGQPVARKSTCQSNMRELGMALCLYMHDYHGRLPSSILCGGSKSWNERNFVCFASKFGDKSSSPTCYRILYSHMRNKEILWCPADPNSENYEPGYGKWPWYRPPRATPETTVSYYWKAAIDYAWYQGCQREKDFAYPADQIVLYEHNGWHWGQSDKGLVDGVSVNCLLLDGHVGSKRIKNSGCLASENPPGPLPKSGIGEPAWFNCNFDADPSKTVRGRLWDPRHCGDSLP